MDSGLGSDEEQRRSRTKEQKQRHNEQLLTGTNWFIDASSLQDDEVNSVSEEQRRHDERRQGALLFQSSIPQYSTMLQLSGDSETPPDTPFNSIVQIENDDCDLNNGNTSDREDDACDGEDKEDIENNAQKPSLGFYVDLSEVDVEIPCPEPCSSVTKNIFSMVIDFEAPKKEKPTRLLRSAGRRRLTNGKLGNGLANGSSIDNGSETEGDAGNGFDSPFSSLTITRSSKVDADIPMIVRNDDKSESSPNLEANRNLEESRNDVKCLKIDEYVKEIDCEAAETCKFVRLSDLDSKPRIEPDVCNDFVGARMSKSIPESSWVESPLLMSRSAGYRIAPRPLEPDTTNSSLSESTGSRTGVSQRRLGTDLLRMFLEELDTDTTIHVGSRAIRAHRCILISRCQYFAGTLRGRSLTLEGFSYESVHFALCHIYSGAAHVPDSINLVELASLGDMLSLEGLKEVVAHALKSRHCHNFHTPCAGCLTGVLEVLPLSAAYGLDELYLRCLKWLTKNYLRVWPSRAFASLPKELREKCYQQHVIHMCAENVLHTCLSCDRLLASLPALRWAEPVVLLALQLADASQLYIKQHFTMVLLSLVDVDPWNLPRSEEIIFSAMNGLNLDQTCLSYVKCLNLLDDINSDENPTLSDVLEKLKSHLEQLIVSRGTKLNKCAAFNRMETNIKLRIRKLANIENEMNTSTSSSYKKEISRLPRMIKDRITTSSSESSRNSSPANSAIHTSPSLRRSLLLAARAPQIPPRALPVPQSPSTTRRFSTLTQPTASSSAKNAPSKNLKPTIQKPIQPRQISKPQIKVNVQQRSASASAIGSSLSRKQIDTKPASSIARINTNLHKKESSVDSKKASPRTANPVRGSASCTSMTNYKKTNNNSTNTYKNVSSNYKNVSSSIKNVSSVGKNVSTANPKTSKVQRDVYRSASARNVVTAEFTVVTSSDHKSPSPIPKSPCMQRSTTFLKDEPTVLTRSLVDVATIGAAAQ